MVVSVDSVSKSPFDEMRHGSRNYGDYGITTQKSPEQNSIPKEENKTVSTNSKGELNPLATLDQDIIDTVVQPKKTKSQRIRAGLIVGGSGFALAGLTYALSKGKIVKLGSKLVNNFFKRITGKIEELDKKETLSTMESVYYSSLQNINKTAQKTRGTILNYTPIKDCLFSRFLKEKLHLGKVCDTITNGFRKVSFGTVKSNYAKTSQRISEMTDSFTEINSRILSGEFSHLPAQKEQIMETIERKTSEIIDTFNNNFTEIPIKRRSQGLSQKLEGLDKRVYNGVYGDLKGFIKDSDYWTKFIPEELIKEDKEQFINNLMSKKRTITNNPQDNYKELQEVLSELKKHINPDNNDSIYMLKYLKSLSKMYSGLSGTTEMATRQEIIKKINTLIRDSKTKMSTNPHPTENTAKINELLNRFGTIVNADKKGAIEELLTIYKQILPAEEYAKIKSIARKAVKSVNKSVKKEGSDYVDKLRDLSVGSALTDVAFTLGVPVVASTVAISRADTKEKKRSIALKYAIPLFVGIGTSTLCTIKLIAGGKALIAAAISSIGANQIGEFIDDKLRNKTNTNNTSSTTTKR